MALGLKETTDKAIKDHGIDAKVSKFLHLIMDNTLNDKAERDNKNELIRALFKEGFDIHDPSGTKKIGSKVLQQCLWRVMSKIKFLDYAIHGTGKEDAAEQLTTEGVRTVMDRGDLSQCFRDKCGVFQNACMYGDGFLFFGKGENDENPVKYRVLRNEDVYADNFAYGVRGVRPANKMVVIFQFDKDEAYELWPELKENNIFGRIPGTYEDDERDSDREATDILEIAWAWDKSMKDHIIFAGTQGYLVDEFCDEEYPYMKNGKPYIPVFQFLCQPSEDGFWNYGIGDMVYDLAVVTAKLLNMEVGHIEENVHPVTLINAPQSKVDELVMKMSEAALARKAGKKPFVAMEFDAQGGQQSVAAQSLLTQNLASEWQIVWDRLVREISRLGINIDDADRGAGFTATQIYAEEETQNAFVKQMQEYNASETKELIECSLDAIKEFVSTRNDTELNLMTRIKLKDNSTMRIDKKVTMGMLSKELKDNNYFVVVNARGGVDKSDLLRMTNLQQQLAITPPGSPEYSELYRRISEIRGLDMELGQQPVPTEGGAGVEQQQAAQEQIPTQPGTPQSVNPQDLMKIMESQPF